MQVQLRRRVGRPQQHWAPPWPGCEAGGCAWSRTCAPLKAVSLRTQAVLVSQQIQVSFSGTSWNFLSLHIFDLWLVELWDAGCKPQGQDLSEALVGRRPEGQGRGREDRVALSPQAQPADMLRPEWPGSWHVGCPAG